MLKKAKAEAQREAAGEDAQRGGDTQGKAIADAVLESSRQIWLAGLGAFARAKGEGAKMFETLVEQGQSLESRTRAAAAGTASAAREAAQAKAKEMQAKAGGTWDKLEQVFEDRVARALSRLGVHTQADVARLTERVDALSDAVNQLIRTSGGTPAPRRRAPKGAPKPARASASQRRPKGTKAATRRSESGPGGDGASKAPRAPRKSTRRGAKAAGTP
jgi:poly(hydroxyalkanoate) granule-associated protein